MDCRKLLSTLLALILLVSLPLCVHAEERTEPAHPIFAADAEVPAAATKDRFVNILLLGIDHGFRGYTGSGNKSLDDAHTDAFLVVSINMTDLAVNMISVPRDTVTYVPGVKGLYKLNAAINCGETMEEGLQHACDAASWVLGGIPIDYYACADMAAMIALGDHIGGADVDVEMNYRGGTGRYYRKGMQHLDGLGLMDYARARRNATVNANDLGRTARQRQVVEAIYRTVANDLTLIKSTWNCATKGELNFYTNMKLGTLVNLANKIRGAKEIGSYVLTGPYRMAAHWNFTFTDQANRKEVLKTVYGIDAEELDYVDYDSVMWLERYGFDYVHAINLTQEIIAFGEAMENRTGAQTFALNDLKSKRESALTAFHIAAATLTNEDTAAVKTAVKQLCAAAEKAVKELGYSERKPNWDSKKNFNTWVDDPFINEARIRWA